MNVFFGSTVVSVLLLLSAFAWGGPTAVFLASVLAVLELSLSFDNAVVNAKILAKMEEKWQRIFMTWGILIAVFGMRIFFPLVIVAVTAHISLFDVLHLAFAEPENYAAKLTSAHPAIAAFGGMFLFMVFLDFLVDSEKEVHWIRAIEKPLSAMGRLESVELGLSLVLLLSVEAFLPEELKLTVLVSGIFGLISYVAVASFSTYMQIVGERNAKAGVAAGGFGSFLYLEVLDSSFSFDGVIGAFAITFDIVVIGIGLGIGALFVRSLTIAMVKQKTLSHYRYLEHGAFYAIGALAIIMLLGITIHIPEVVTGLLGGLFIAVSFYSSLRHNKAERNGNKL